jgi:replicative DNA helicase
MGKSLKIHERINKLKEDPLEFDKILYPGTQLSDFDITKLRIEILPSGFKSFDDKKIFKKGRGEFIILGARPSQGKSGLGFQIATQISTFAKCHIFSLEMEHESVAARQMAITMNKSIDYIQNGGAESKLGEEAKAKLNKLNLVIDDRSGLNVYQICDAAKRQHKKAPTSLIVIDYLQIIADTEKDGNRARTLATISWELRCLARELRVPVLALSQLNRQSEFREGGRPQSSDLKESGALEQDADVILLIHRPEDTPGAATIIVSKNRNGPTGDIPMNFAPSMCRFTDIDESDLD